VVFKIIPIGKVDNSKCMEGYKMKATVFYLLLVVFSPIEFSWMALSGAILIDLIL
jgi:hypothetical protein